MDHTPLINEIRDDIKYIKQRLDSMYVTQTEFAPVKYTVYLLLVGGAIGVLGSFTIWMLI